MVRIITPKKKTCKGCDTPQYIFSKGLCKNCWGRMQSQNKPIEGRNKAVQPLSRKSGYKIPPRTKKRSEQEKSYSKIVEKMNKDKVKVCFFCGEVMKKPEDHHHVAGRWGQDLLYEKLIVHAHRECHANYHDLPVSKLPWFMDYLNRLSDIDTDLAGREMEKYKK